METLTQEHCTACRAGEPTLTDEELEQLRPHLELIDANEAGTEIVPGVRLIAAPGHTPGHMVVAVSSEGRQLLHVLPSLHDVDRYLRKPSWGYPARRK